MAAETAQEAETTYFPVRVHVQLVDGENLNPSGANQHHILVTPHPFRVQAGQPLIFESDRPFAVQFVGTAPLQGALVDLRNDPAPPWLTELREQGERVCQADYCYGQLTRDDAARVETYKYTVAVVEPRSDGPDRVHISDPEGVLDPDPTRAY